MTFKSTGLIPVFAFFLALVTPAVAQETSGPIERPPQPESLREQSIYIPYDKLRRTFEQQGRGVFLPYEKFQELWQAARDKQPPPELVGPPVGAIITEIVNEALVQDDVVRVTAHLKIDLLGKGWIEVPLRLSDAALLSATIANEPALIVSAEGVGHKLLVHKPQEPASQIELQLEYAKSITKESAQNSVEFQAPLAPVNRWRIRIPESRVKVNIQPMLAATVVPAENVPEGNGENATDRDPSDLPADQQPGTEVLAFVGATDRVRIDWTPKAEGASGLDALVSVQTEQEVIVDEGVIRTLVRLNYEISRAELSQLKLEVPGDQRVVNVTDANLRQWNVEVSDTMQTITMGLFQPARDRQSLLVELEKFQSETTGQLDVPVVKTLGVGRQRGIVVVRLADGLRAEPVRRSGLSQLDVNEIPESLRGQAWAYSFRYAALPFELALQVEKVEPRIHVVQLVEAYLEPQQLTLELFAKYDIQRAGVFELQLDLPPSFEVRQVSGHEAAGAKAAVVDTYVVDPADAARPRLKINLASKAEGPIGLRVVLQRRLDDPNLLSPTGQSSVIELLPPRAAGERISRSAGWLVIYAPESLRVVIEQLSGLRNVSFDEAFKDTASQREGRFGDLRPVQALSFSEASASSQLMVQRRQPFVTAQQLLEVRVEPGVMKCQATFFYSIRYSGVKSLRIDLPADIAGRVRNQTESLHETTLAIPQENLAEGYVPWSLTGETELLGETQVKLIWETPINDLELGKSVDLQVPRLIPRNVDRADGQIVLVKAETIDVQPKGEPQGLDPIDAEHDLIGGTRIADAAAALQFQDAWELTVTAIRYQLQMVKQTSIEQALLRLVITRSDRVAVQALYRLRSNRQRLVVQLPDELAAGKIELDTDPLRINGSRVTLERGDDARTFFVPLVGIGTDEPFLLELRYTAAGSGQQLTYPSFPDEPATQKVNLVAYLPHEQSYLGSQGPWTDDLVWSRDALGRRQPMPRVGIAILFNQLTRGINLAGNPAEDFPVDGRPLLFSTLRPAAADVGALRLATFSTRWLDAIVIGLVLLIGVLLLRRPGTDRVVAICAFLALLALTGVFLPTFANAVLNNILLLAVGLVLLLWLASLVAFARPKLSLAAHCVQQPTTTPQPVPADLPHSPPADQGSSQGGGTSDAS